MYFVRWSHKPGQGPCEGAHFGKVEYRSMGGFVVISCARYEPQASPQVSTAPHGGFLMRPLAQKGYLERGLRRENGCDNEGQTNVREHMLRTTPPQRPFGVPLKHRSTGDDKPLWRSNNAHLNALSSCRPATCFPLYPACPQRLDPHVVCAQNTPHGGQKRRSAFTSSVLLVVCVLGLFRSFQAHTRIADALWSQSNYVLTCGPRNADTDEHASAERKALRPRRGVAWNMAPCQHQAAPDIPRNLSTVLSTAGSC